MSREHDIRDLRARIAALEQAGPNRDRGNVIPTGLEPVDARLAGGGLAAGALHEVVSGAPSGYAAEAAGWIGSLLARRQGTVLWCAAAGDLYGPGLAACAGLDPGRLLLVRAGRDIDLLWALEEGLRHGCLTAVVGEIAALDNHASRRLQLAAREAAVPAFLLRRPRRGRDLKPAAAVETRWRLTPQPSASEVMVGRAEMGLTGMGTPRFYLELIRNRRGPTGDWLIEFHHETHAFRVLPDLVHRPQILAARQGGAAAAG